MDYRSDESFITLTAPGSGQREMIMIDFEYRNRCRMKMRE